MEKVFGTDRDRAELSFAYQLGNRSMTPCSFTFATELSFALPGIAVGKAGMRSGKKRHEDFLWDRLNFKDVTEMVLEDWQSGVRVTVKTQKPVSVWCHPVGTPSSGYQGTALILSLPVEMSANSLWSLVGKIHIRAIRRR